MAAKPIARKVMALKAKGLSFSKIGEKLGFTKTRAQQIHSRVLAEQSGS